ncbi:MAG: GerMN domain-containing protein [Acidobacteriota bacterium]|nr:GerMN domain-containing protein [Acidobacteriota bacterium]MDE3044291.1 GerMN domain-containing protein [Acidobacteriota bacterium]MDE3106833.1 GerMN domain-containing protein [Acidobacteriota bacterium]
MKFLRPTLALVVSSLALSACTLISADRAPQPVAKSQVPFGLLHRYIPQTNRGRVIFVTQPVYLLDVGDRLAPASRIVPRPVQLDAVLRELLLGPSKIESFAGYASALPKTLVLVSAVIKHKVGIINLGTRLSGLSLTQQLRAEGQLVLTSAAAGATRGVIIEVAEIPQALPLPNGKRAHFLTSAEFQSLL